MGEKYNELEIVGTDWWCDYRKYCNENLLDQL